MWNYLLVGYIIIIIDFDRKAVSTTNELHGYFWPTQWSVLDYTAK